MKINQLFVKHVDEEMLGLVLKCFNLRGLNDHRLFCKYDMAELGTVQKLQEIKDKLSAYYIPCKARLYLENMTEKRAVTVLKQLLRLHSYKLWSKEKNHNHKKIIFYQLVPDNHQEEPTTMRKLQVKNVISFDY